MASVTKTQVMTATWDRPQRWLTTRAAKKAKQNDPTKIENTTTGRGHRQKCGPNDCKRWAVKSVPDCGITDTLSVIAACGCSWRGRHSVGRVARCWQQPEKLWARHHPPSVDLVGCDLACVGQLAKHRDGEARQNGGLAEAIREAMRDASETLFMAHAGFVSMDAGDDAGEEGVGWEAVCGGLEFGYGFGH